MEFALAPPQENYVSITMITCVRYCIIRKDFNVVLTWRYWSDGPMIPCPNRALAHGLRWPKT